MQIEQAQRICDNRSAFADALGNVLLPKRKILAEPLVCVRLLDWIQVFAWQVVDQRQIEHVAIRSMADYNGRFFQAELVGGSPTPLPCNEFKFALALANDQRLDYSVFADGFDEFLKLVRSKSLSGLQRAGHDFGQCDPFDAFPRFYRVGCFVGTNQRTKSFTENNLCHRKFEANGQDGRKQRRRRRYED